MRYVDELSKEERITVEQGVRHGKKQHFRHRCQSILMSADGYKVSEIARLFKVRTRTVYTWFDRWKTLGVAGLMILPGRGKKSRLNNLESKQIDQIRKQIEKNPQNLKQVCEELSQTLGITITKNTLKSFVKKTRLQLETTSEMFEKQTRSGRIRKEAQRTRPIVSP